ncbi:hypothetical protein BC629DRAFT_143569 [Irpex lacteus]|nr:hypothetical protein BC629DRAFT_143569 [Irpex lacteus]
MSVSAIASRGTRERFVFVRRRPSLCGDRLDGQLFTPFVSGTRSNSSASPLSSHRKYSLDTPIIPSSASCGGYGVKLEDYGGPSMKTLPWSPTLNRTACTDEPNFTTAINHICPVVDESRAGSEPSDSSSDGSSDTIVALEPPTKPEAPADNSTSRMHRRADIADSPLYRWCSGVLPL